MNSARETRRRNKKEGAFASHIGDNINERILHNAEERIFFDAILGEDSDDENVVFGNSESKYEKIGDYKVKDYVERPHEYQK